MRQAFQKTYSETFPFQPWW